MPTYSYACTECANRFDAVQAFTDDALTTCSQCSGRLRKLFGSVGVVFKGSGFYRTDSRAGSAESSKESAAASESPSSTKEADSSSDTPAKTDSKPADTAKSDGKSKSASAAPAAVAS